VAALLQLKHQILSLPSLWSHGPFYGFYKPHCALKLLPLPLGWELLEARNRFWAIHFLCLCPQLLTRGSTEQDCEKHLQKKKRPVFHNGCETAAETPNPSQENVLCKRHTTLCIHKKQKQPGETM
jgi:hypothetical protein